jgi:hypothetical protein
MTTRVDVFGLGGHACDTARLDEWFDHTGILFTPKCVRFRPKAVVLDVSTKSGIDQCQSAKHPLHEPYRIKEAHKN